MDQPRMSVPTWRHAKDIWWCDDHVMIMVNFCVQFWRLWLRPHPHGSGTQVPRGSMTILFKALDPQMLPGHKTNGAPRKSNMVGFPLLKWRGMAERKGRLVQPKGLHWGGQSLKLSSHQREAILISLIWKLIQKKGGEGTPCGKINNPFGSLWV